MASRTPAPGVPYLAPRRPRANHISVAGGAPSTGPSSTLCMMRVALLYTVTAVTVPTTNATVSSPAVPTDWGSIGPDLAARWAQHLPPVPALGLDTSGWVPDPTGAFQRIDANLSAVNLCDPAAAATWPAGSVAAGGLWDCDGPSAACSGGITAATCRGMSEYNNRDGMVLVAGKPGMHWAKATAQPAWIQFRFPKPTAAVRPNHPPPITRIVPHVHGNRILPPVPHAVPEPCPLSISRRRPWLYMCTVVAPRRTCWYGQPHTTTTTTTPQTSPPPSTPACHPARRASSFQASFPLILRPLMPRLPSPLPKPPTSVVAAHVAAHYSHHRSRMLPVVRTRPTHAIFRHAVC